MTEHLSTTDLASYWALRRSAVWWLEPACLIRAWGSDAQSYLQTQITQNIIPLKVGEGCLSALVDRKALLQSLFSIHLKEPDDYWLFPEAQSEQLFQHLENHHFVEQVDLEKRDGGFFLHLEGPDTLGIIQELCGLNLADIHAEALVPISVAGESAYLIKHSVSAESGARLYLPQKPAAIIDTLQSQFSLLELTPAAYQSVRLEAGLPDWQHEIQFNQTSLPQTGLEKERAAYDKGCYLGQEVIARIKSYGVVPYALMGFVSDQKLPIGELKLADKRVGQVTSTAWSPQLKSWIALGYLHKNQRENNKKIKVSIENKEYSLLIKRLPIYSPPTLAEQARKLYEQALDLFANDDESESILLLQAAIAKDTNLADAYESLGVILSRQNRHQEAIQIMNKLTEIKPEEPMAHTNLSRFHMLLGDKLTAEFHMAEATRLNMLKEVKQRSVKAQEQQQRAQKEEMMAMFKEVLESEDPRDLVANYGLGKSLVDLERYQEAIPYLQTAVDVDPFYSAAYLQLGLAQESAELKEAARLTYQQGIEVAAEKGDLMPKKSMEQRLMGL